MLVQKKIQEIQEIQYRSGLVPNKIATFLNMHISQSQIFMNLGLQMAMIRVDN